MATKTAPKVPKTPTRGRQTKTREPLTPSLTKALNNLNLRSVSPIKQVSKIGPDVSINPFLEHQVPIGQSLRNNALFGGGGSGKSRPSSRPGSRAGSRPGSRSGSPTKRSRSASRGRTKNVVTICGVEQRLDIVKMDYPAEALSNSQKSANSVEVAAACKARNGKQPKRTKSCSSLVRFPYFPTSLCIVVDPRPFHSAVGTGQIYHAPQSRGGSSRVQPVPHLEGKFPGAYSTTRRSCGHQSRRTNPHIPPGPATRARPVPQCPADLCSAFVRAGKGVGRRGGWFVGRWVRHLWLEATAPPHAARTRSRRARYGGRLLPQLARLVVAKRPRCRARGKHVCLERADWVCLAPRRGVRRELCLLSRLGWRWRVCRDWAEQWRSGTLGCRSGPTTEVDGRPPSTRPVS